MHVVVVGASGNVGTAVLRRLHQEPAVQSITGIARRLPPRGSGFPYDGVRWLSYDIGVPGSPAPLAGVLQGADAVIHLAWQIQPSHRRELLRRTNVEGTKHLVEAYIRAGIPKLVYASSVGTYAPGPKDRMVDETWPATGVPGSSYSADKAAVEHYLDGVEGEHPDWTVIRLRPALIFQADAAAEILRYFAGPLAPASLLRYGRPPVVPHAPELRTQVVHADDVADAYVRCVRGDAGTVGGAFNIATQPVLDGRAVAEHFGGRTVPVPTSVLETGAGLTWRLRAQPAEAGWVSMGRLTPLMDCRRAETELGWKPARDAFSALSELLEGMGQGRGTTSPVLRPREPAAERLRAILRGHLPGHSRYY